MMIFGIVVAGLIALTVFAVMVWLGTILNTDRSIGNRLETYVSPSGTVVEVAAHISDDNQNNIANRLNTRLDNLSIAEQIRRNLARADVPLTVAEYILLKTTTTLLPAAIVLLLSRSLLGFIAVAFVGFLAPSFWLKRRQRQRSRMFEEQLPDALATVIGSLRGGYSLVQSLGNVGREAPNPTAMEMRRVTQEVQFGISVNDALSNLAQRMESQDLELLVAVLKIHTRVGGNLTTVLENISTTIKERTRLRREIRVITSQQRYASYVLGLLPVILTLILMTINPTYMMRLFQPGWTLIIPIFAVFMNVLGFIAIQKIVDIKV